MYSNLTIIGELTFYYNLVTWSKKSNYKKLLAAIIVVSGVVALGNILFKQTINL